MSRLKSAIRGGGPRPKVPLALVASGQLSAGRIVGVALLTVVAAAAVRTRGTSFAAPRSPLAASVEEVGAPEPAPRPGTAAPALGRGPPSEPELAPPNRPSPLPPASNAVRLVVLITVDAFRADQPWVGYREIETPHLTSLAERSVVYRRAYSLATITTASLNSMLSSRYSSELERDACIFARYDLEGSLGPTLHAAAVKTAAGHGLALFAGRTAPSLGFDRWDLVAGVGGRLQSDGAVVGAEIADLVIRILGDARSGEDKTFVWAHFPDPHDAYVAHREFHSTSRDPSRTRYDSEVAYTDAAIGRVLDALERFGLWERTAVIVTGDHGEAFGEHGALGHGHTMFEEEIRVPLLVRVPGVAPRVVDVPRSAIDIAPTIADLFGVALPPRWKGHSLLADAGADALEVRPVVVDLPEMNLRSKTQAVVTGSLKIVTTRMGSVVYDLAADPGERTPLRADDERSQAAASSAREQLGRLAPVVASPCGR